MLTKNQEDHAERGGSELGPKTSVPEKTRKTPPTVETSSFQARKGRWRDQRKLGERTHVVNLKVTRLPKKDSPQGEKRGKGDWLCYTISPLEQKPVSQARRATDSKSQYGGGNHGGNTAVPITLGKVREDRTQL